MDLGKAFDVQIGQILRNHNEMIADIWDLSL